ncbi:MAG: hypothetical protein K8H88_31880 [Sandaracinaceae bacterium]|nr:hypothetical protein [Sandaracinaceae bacterium]
MRSLYTDDPALAAAIKTVAAHRPTSLSCVSGIGRLRAAVLLTRDAEEALPRWLATHAPDLSVIERFVPDQGYREFSRFKEALGHAPAIDSPEGQEVVAAYIIQTRRLHRLALSILRSHWPSSR